MTTQPTIKFNSSGEAVSLWQKIVGVPVDGKFGTTTETATKKYQTAHGLKGDGVVGPLTWASTTPKIISTGMISWFSSLPLWSVVAAATIAAGGLVLALADKLYMSKK